MVKMTVKTIVNCFIEITADFIIYFTAKTNFINYCINYFTEVDYFINNCQIKILFLFKYFIYTTQFNLMAKLSTFNYPH